MPYLAPDRIKCDPISPTQFNEVIRCFHGTIPFTEEVHQLIATAKASYPSQCPRLNAIAQIARCYQ